MNTEINPLRDSPLRALWCVSLPPLALHCLPVWNSLETQPPPTRARGERGGVSCTGASDEGGVDVMRWEQRKTREAQEAPLAAAQCKCDSTHLRPVDVHGEGGRRGVVEREARALIRDPVGVRHADAGRGAVPREAHVVVRAGGRHEGGHGTREEPPAR